MGWEGGSNCYSTAGPNFTTEEAEAQAAILGAQLAISRRVVKKVVIESDCTSFMTNVNGTTTNLSPLGHLTNVFKNMTFGFQSQSVLIKIVSQIA